MNINDKIYFGNFINYKPRVNKSLTSKYLQDIKYISSQIRDTAKDALSEEISSRKAKKEISDLLESIKELKKESK
jgi:hypothetical protein